VPPDSRVDPRRLFSVVSPVDICGSYASLAFEGCVFETRILTGLPLQQGARAGESLGSQRERIVCSRLKAVRAGDLRTCDGVSANTKTLRYLLSRRFLE